MAVNWNTIVTDKQTFLMDKQKFSINDPDRYMSYPAHSSFSYLFGKVRKNYRMKFLGWMNLLYLFFNRLGINLLWSATLELSIDGLYTVMDIRYHTATK